MVLLADTPLFRGSGPAPLCPMRQERGEEMTYPKLCPLLAKYGVRPLENVRLNEELELIENYPHATICTDKCTRKECWYVEREAHHGL